MDAGIPTVPEEEDDDAIPVPAPGTSIGRFFVLGPIGMGGMGMVLSAYDPDLDRKVALKLLRSDVWRGERAADGRDALVREAQAMARLAHPNVVPVHEVGFQDEFAYLVMEQVEGRTLRSWLAEKPRGWREIVETLRQAGAGLAAAHDAGIVHRDFKPDNVLVGLDGRPRMSDFGLAGGASAATGTPAYMSPEQRAGSRGGTEVDQYAFCVTLWESLEGVRPGASPPLPSPGRAPAWVYRVLARGLAEQPEQRWPSMHALIAALRPRASPLRLVAAAGALLAVGAAAFLAGDLRSAPACDAGAAQIAPLWDEATRTRVSAAFAASGRPYAADTFARVDASLRARTNAWAAAHSDTCEATHVRGEQSGAVLDVRMRCLARARAEIASLVALLEKADAATVDRAAVAAAQTGDVAACADPPPAAQTTPEVEAARLEVATLPTLRRLGKWKEGLVTGRELLGRVRALGSPSLVAAVLIEVGRFELDAGSLDAGVALLYEAVQLASSAGDDRGVADAASVLSYALGARKLSFPAAEVAFRFAAVSTARAGSPAVSLSRLLSYRGDVLKAQGDHAGALGMYLLVAGMWKTLYGPESYELAIGLTDLAETDHQLGRIAEARVHFEHALAVTEKVVGANHPSVATSLRKYGFFLADIGDHRGAQAVLARALAITEAAFGPDSRRVGDLGYVLAITHAEQHQLAEARSIIERALRINQAQAEPDPLSEATRQEVLGLIVRRQGDPARAHAITEQALAIKRRLYPDGAHAGLAFTLQLDAEHLLAAGRTAEARARIDEAIATYQKVSGPRHPDLGDAWRVFAAIVLADGRTAEAAAALEHSLALLEPTYGPDSPRLRRQLLALADLALDAGDGARGLALAERARRTGGVEADLAAADLRVARARWLRGEDRPSALATARAARARLAALPFAYEDLAATDRWLAARR